MRVLEAPTTADVNEIIAVWEASVRSTHYFLTEEDIQAYKASMPEALNSVSIVCVRDNNSISGFIGIAEQKIGMLFIHPDLLGKGIGKMLLSYAIHTHHSRFVDVNEQNEQALDFYLHFGFRIIGRSETDGLQKPYPLLHLQLME